MSTRAQFIAAATMVFLGISTNTAEASLRGIHSSVEATSPIECPIEIPSMGSRCQEADDDESATCYYNLVQTPAPSEDFNIFVASISCSCRNEHWECGISPEYLKALVEAASG
jgi:hypothetical protein